MTDFPYCELCGQTVAITRERDETKPTVAELRAEIERLRLRVKFLEDELKCPAALEKKPYEPS